MRAFRAASFAGVVVCTTSAHAQAPGAPAPPAIAPKAPDPAVPAPTPPGAETPAPAPAVDALSGAAPTPEVQAEAKKIFLEGRTQMARFGKLNDACLTLTKSYELHKRGDTLLNLAECHRRQKKVATAWREFDEAIRYAEEVEFTEAIEAAKTLRDALAKDLSELTVQVPTDPPTPEGLVVLLDDKPLPSQQWGQKLYVDPGPHTVSATAPGYEPYAGSAEVKEQADRAIIEVKLTKVPPPPEPPKPPPPPPPKVVPKPPPPPPPAPEGEVPAWGVVVGSAGLAMMGVSVGFGIYTVDVGGELDDQCGEERLACPSDYDFASAHSDELTGFGVFVGLGAAGIAATATGVVAVIAGLSGGGEAEPAVAVVPWAVPGGGGVVVGGKLW